MKPSTKFAQQRDAVAAFIAEYRALLDAYEQERASGTSGSLGNEIDEARGRVAAAAGAASVATSRFGGTYTVKPPGSIQSVTLDPIATWAGPFECGHMLLTTRDVLEWALQCHGALAADAEKAAQRERGLVGLVARFLRFPADVREAAGMYSRAGQRAVFGIAVAVQTVVTGVFVGVLVTGIVRALGWN